MYCNLIMCGKLSLQTFFSMSYISIYIHIYGQEHSQKKR